MIRRLTAQAQQYCPPSHSNLSLMDSGKEACRLNFVFKIMCISFFVILVLRFNNNDNTIKEERLIELKGIDNSLSYISCILTEASNLYKYYLSFIIIITKMEGSMQ